LKRRRFNFSGLVLEPASLLWAGCMSVFSLVACSERTVTHNLTDPRSSVLRQFSDSRTDNREQRDPLDIKLLSEPAFETSLEKFSTAVQSPKAKSYKFSIEDGKNSDCSKLGSLRSITELMTLPVGKAGPKTICLQAADSEGRLGRITRFNFNKVTTESEFPETLLSGVLSGYTAKSEALMSVVTPSASEYRASFTAVNDIQAKCKTLEANPWKESHIPVSLKFAYDGTWLLCVEVRDKNGKRSVAPKAFRWTRDTVFPVADSPELPTQPTEQSEFNLTVSGNLVESYQYALIEGNSTCTGATYSAFAPVSTPLNLRIPKDGTWTFCLQTEGKGGIRQQVPYIHTLTKVSPVQSGGINEQQMNQMPPTPQPDLNPKAKVKLNPVQVSSSLVPRSDNRTFTISGANVTHYKAQSFDTSTTCPASPPVTAAAEVSQPLTVAFSRANVPFSYSDTQDLQNIRTLCVWGIKRAADNSEVVQAAPTWFRFYNSTGYSMTGKNIVNAVPNTMNQTKAVCSCHDSLRTVSGWEEKALAASWYLRRDRMPGGSYFQSAPAEKASLYGFLETVSGYPLDLPYVISP
jgi:hypothetical protein